MFDWFAARPPRTEVPTRDRPSIPLTPEERLEFEALRRQVERRSALASQLTSGIRSVGGWGGLAAGVVLVVVGGFWCIAWLTTSVPLSFVGVLVQAVGLRVALDSPGLKPRRDGSVGAPSASPAQTHAHRRRGH